MYPNRYCMVWLKSQYNPYNMAINNIAEEPLSTKFEVERFNVL